MSEATSKVKIISVMCAQLEPLIFENGFRKVKKGIYIRLKGEILQFIYFYTYRPPCDVRFAMIPYWAVKAERISNQYYEDGSYNVMNTSAIADILDKNDDYERYLLDPSYRRWNYDPHNIDEINRVVSLYKEKLSDYIIPYLNAAVDFSSYFKIELELLHMQNRNYIYSLPREVIKYQCILESSYYSLVYGLDKAEISIKEAKRKEVLDEPALYRRWLSWAKESPDTNLTQKEQKIADYTKKIAELDARTPDDIEKEVDERYQESVPQHRKQFQEFYDAIESNASLDVWRDEVMMLREQMKDVIAQSLKLYIE